MTTVGYIGLGRMGGGMALNLAKSVSPVYVFDPISEAMKPLLDAGAIACDSAADIAKKCDLIFMCLPFAPEVRAVMFGPGGIHNARRNELTIVDSTTLDRTDAIAICKEAAEVGITYWDCPISGMPFRAHDGTLTMMFGGSAEGFAFAKPYLDDMGEHIIHAGPVGCGQAMKALNNIVYDINIAAISEVIPLALAVGLDADLVAELMTTGSSKSFASEYFVPRMMDRAFHTDFAMEDAYKDIINVQRMRDETGASIPVVDAMVKSYQSTMDAGFGREPKSAMIKVYEEKLGVKFTRPDAKD
jgi:3-hydroxyisobutyrate dehydrogenase-like beta-hydroxyacid dehydrogenase